jgi:hypothetical protein
MRKWDSSFTLITVEVDALNAFVKTHRALFFKEMNFTSVNLIKKFQNRTGKLAQVVEDLPSPEFKPSTATPKLKKKKTQI